MENQTQTIKEGKIVMHKYRLILRNGKPIIQFYDGETLLEEFDLHEVIKEIDKLVNEKFMKEEFRCEFEDVEQLNKCIGELWMRLLIRLNTIRKSWRIQVATFIPLAGGDFYERVERIYVLCYNGRRYDVYAWRGWYFAEIGLDWHLIITPKKDEWCETYCKDRFCP